MGIINELDFHVANLIAAGEVVDRPASVVKELLENAIDAGGQQIVVEIKNGGVSFIRVSDNGKGMSSDDVPICIKRHATSKIRYSADLDGIMTLGFRGEALAAIAAVSKLRIMTKPAADNVGTLMICESGEILELTESGCQNGTTVIVEDLFANVPARRKFLKKDSSETAAVTAVVEKIALSRCDISLKYIVDGNMRFHTAGDGKLENTIYAVLGRELAKKMTDVRGLTEGIEVSGYIGRPDYVKSNRNYQNFFINGRYVKSATAMAALEQAFHSYIPSDKFPCCVLNIKIHPAYVDVNVHPAKLEVKFSNDKIVFDAIYCAVRNTLAYKVKRPEMELSPTLLTGDDLRVIAPHVPLNEIVAESPVLQDYLSEAHQIKIDTTRSFPAPDILYDEEEIKPPEPKQGAESKAEPEPIMEPEPTAERKPEAEAEPEELDIPYYRILGVSFNAYIFVELESRVTIIDKHAAHERIIFEDMKRNLNGGAHTQMTLVPVPVRLNETEYSALMEYRDDIQAMGFGIETGDEAGVLHIVGYPPEIELEAVPELLSGLAAGLADGTASPSAAKSILFEKALYQASCKAAMKAGRNDDMGHIRWICDRILTMPDIKFCPHGRPVAFDLGKNDIERQFKRI